jgi:hypothetical protein
MRETIRENCPYLFSLSRSEKARPVACDDEIQQLEVSVSVHGRLRHFGQACQLGTCLGELFRHSVIARRCDGSAINVQFEVE